MVMAAVIRTPYAVRPRRCPIMTYRNVTYHVPTAEGANVIGRDDTVLSAYSAVGLVAWRRSHAMPCVIVIRVA